jgi:hypothetical protein
MLVGAGAVIVSSCVTLDKLTKSGYDPLAMVDNISHGRPPTRKPQHDGISSSLDDAIKPQRAIPIKGYGRLSGQRIWKTRAGGLVFTPGYYELDLQSYCLHVGSYGPGRGSGYVQARIQGELAPYIRHILQHSAMHDDIRQSKIQSLIWALQSHTRVQDLPHDLQQVAIRLLSPKELFELNGMIKAFVKQNSLDKLQMKLPPEMQRSLQAYSALRKQLVNLNTSYKQLERIAVLHGNPVPPPGSRNYRPGEWTYHDGFYVSVLPSTYKHTRMRILAPPGVRVIRDKQRHIKQLQYADGGAVYFAYSRLGTIDVRYPNGRVYPVLLIDRISFVPGGTASQAERRLHSTVLRHPGWILDLPSLRRYGLLKSMQYASAGNPPPLPRYQPQPATNLQVSQTATGPKVMKSAALISLNKYVKGEIISEAVSRLPKSTQLAYKGLTKYVETSKQFTDAMRPPRKQDLDNFLDIQHYSDMLINATNLKDRGKFLAEHVHRLLMAASYINICLRNLKCPDAGKSGSGLKHYDPTQYLSMPGNRAAQRLGESVRLHSKYHGYASLPMYQEPAH